MSTPENPANQAIDLSGPQKFNIFGYEIGEWSTGLALILSIVGLLWQATSWFIGADISLLPFQTVEFTCPLSTDENGGETICNPDRPYLILAVGRLNVVNSGSDGYDTFIDAGQVKIDFLNKDQKSLKSITLQALYFSDRTDSGTSQVAASPLYVKAGSVSSTEVEYYPRKLINKEGAVDRRNFLSYDDFKKLVSVGESQNSVKYIEIIMEINEIEDKHKEYKIQCKLQIDDEFRNNAMDPERLNFIRDCM